MPGFDQKGPGGEGPMTGRRMGRKRQKYIKKIGTINKINQMKKCIAIPLESGQLCAHFGHCEQFAIIETENGKIIKESLIAPPDHQPGLYPAWISQFGVTDVIAGGMGQRAIDLFNQHRINVFVGAPTRKPYDLVTDFMIGKLEVGANYCDH
jgi:predicted Fe-Mo cluster-binding NifX family protein